MNYSTHNEGAVIRSTEFHPTSTVGLVTGLNGAASLFQGQKHFMDFFDEENIFFVA